MSRKSWFVVDPDGLRKSSAHRNKAFIAFELWQNAVDEDSRNINITLEPVEGKPLVELTVEDDNPEGFRNLEHAYTMFAESSKKGDPNKRGFMNVGEKLVLAYCKQARIETTTGTVIFDVNGRRQTAKKRETGSVFWGLLQVTRDEMKDIIEGLNRLISPEGVLTTITTPDGRTKLMPRKALTEFEASLPTRIEDPETGEMRNTVRKTTVRVYEPVVGEEPALYEKGIPVVATGDKWHVDIQQKVPLSMDRENVTPAYLKLVRTLVLNHTHLLLDRDEATSNWVRQAASSELVEPDAFKHVIDLRFGEKAVAADPSDREGENIAKGKGYTVVAGGSLNKQEWANVRRFEALKPAGQVTPSPKPFHPDGAPLEFIPTIRWFEDLATRLHLHVFERPIGSVCFTDAPDWDHAGTWTPAIRQLIVNVAKLDCTGERATERHIDFLIHEFAHHGKGGRVAEHLTDEYDHNLSRIGAKLVMLALQQPEWFR